MVCGVALPGAEDGFEEEYGSAILRLFILSDGRSFGVLDLGSKDLETKDLAGRCASRATNIRQPALLIRLQASGLRNVFRGPPGSVIPPITALLLHYRQSDLDS